MIEAELIGDIDEQLSKLLAIGLYKQYIESQYQRDLNGYNTILRVSPRREVIGCGAKGRLCDAGKSLM